MPGNPIPNTDGEYDTDAFNSLPQARKDFGNDNSTITISGGIRTNEDGTEIYMRVRKNTMDTEPVYFENELNKTHLES